MENKQENSSEKQLERRFKMGAIVAVFLSSLGAAYIFGQSSGHKTGITHARWEFREDIAHIERRYSAKAYMFDRLSLTHVCFC